jgi:hypothetical protein
MSRSRQTWQSCLLDQKEVAQVGAPSQPACLSGRCFDGCLRWPMEKVETFNLQRPIVGETGWPFQPRLFSRVFRAPCARTLKHKLY